VFGMGGTNKKSSWLIGQQKLRHTDSPFARYAANALASAVSASSTCALAAASADAAANRDPCS